MRRSVFTIDADAYIGYTSGYLWNRWATPYFEKDEANRVVASYNELAELPIYYDAKTDAFKIDELMGFDGTEWQGEDIQTEDGTKHLYGIGACSWVWDSVCLGNRGIYALSQRRMPDRYGANCGKIQGLGCIQGSNSYL